MIQIKLCLVVGFDKVTLCWMTSEIFVVFFMWIVPKKLRVLCWFLEQASALCYEEFAFSLQNKVISFRNLTWNSGTLLVFFCISVTRDCCKPCGWEFNLLLTPCVGHVYSVSLCHVLTHTVLALVFHVSRCHCLQCSQSNRRSHFAHAMHHQSLPGRYGMIPIAASVGRKTPKLPLALGISSPCWRRTEPRP